MYQAVDEASSHQENARDPPTLGESARCYPPNTPEREMQPGSLADSLEQTNAQQSPQYPLGVAPIKADLTPSDIRPDRSRYLIKQSSNPDNTLPDSESATLDSGHDKHHDRTGKKRKSGGINKDRHFSKPRQNVQLCSSRVHRNEFSPDECKFGPSCKFEHDLRRYLNHDKPQNLTSFQDCPSVQATGSCNLGWKCLLVKSHSCERPTADGRMELVLEQDTDHTPENTAPSPDGKAAQVVNVIPTEDRISLSRRRFETEKANKYIQWLNSVMRDNRPSRPGFNQVEQEDGKNQDKIEAAACYTEAPFRASEKRRLYFGPETPILAPLTTQGNLPFRRLCVELGAQLTCSEMAVGLPIVQGERSEWALLRAHRSETHPPAFHAKNKVLEGYDNTRDLRFGIQIAANKPWVALKTTQVLTRFCPHIRAIDLNAGCPIDLICRQGAGSALLDQPAKLERILQGMNDLSGEIPITVKIRTGTRDNHPTAAKLLKRLILGSGPDGPGPCGVAAVTLHGRTRQQRYTRRADWNYISECGAMIQQLYAERKEVADTVREPDPRDDANRPKNGHVYFIGDGDCFSYTDYYEHLRDHHVDSVMIARGALVKPWIFEEINACQHLDKTSSQRLEYIEKFTRYGLETWGSDEMGLATTRRFLLEYLSFAHRYVPIGLLERLPAHINDRPPAFRGRDELETLMASTNYKDWIKISEMFLGPAPDWFTFEPKHKSNSYEVEG